MTQRSHTWPSLLHRLVAGENLSAEVTEWAMDQVMSGNATSAQIAGFAIALRAKGETPSEISGMADAMLAHSLRVPVNRNTVDIVGTGGDRSGSVNISTMSAIVIAAAGVPVVKHGNRAASSKSGAADVLEALGVAIDLAPGAVARCVEELRLGFCFAPSYHPAFKQTGGPRRELGIPTTFNLLGPLTNPVQPSAALIGCAYQDKTELLAEVFARRGASVLVVRGDDGLDEITTTTTSSALVVSNGRTSAASIDPSRFGIRSATTEDLRGGSAPINAEVVRALVEGKRGPVRDAVLLNSAGAIAAHTGFSGSLEDDLGTGVERAVTAIDSGAAANLLTSWIKLTNDLVAEAGTSVQTNPAARSQAD